MKVTIDENSGFCFGVVNTIRMAEEELDKSGFLYCLGNIVHNNSELNRLKKRGLVVINYEQFGKLNNSKVLIRAHGEPPSTYETARKNNIELIDASCKVVLKLQKRINNNFQEISGQGQIVIFGKSGHAEVNGLVGQTAGHAIVIKELEDLDKIDFSKPVSLFSQTTMNINDFVSISDEIRHRMVKVQKTNEVLLKINDTICRQVANRAPRLRKFATKFNVIIFVSGKESSNGKVLFNECKSVNPNSYFVSDSSEILPVWFVKSDSVGICGATSTPRWLMEDIAAYISELNK